MSELVCEKCGTHIGFGNITNTEGYCCKKCAIGFELKEIFKNVIMPLALACIFLFMSYWALKDTASGLELYLKMLFFSGIPFGMKKMCIWLIPTGRGSVAVSVAIIVLNCIVGGIIGAFILIFRLITALTTLIKCIIRFAQISAITK